MEHGTDGGEITLFLGGKQGEYEKFFTIIRKGQSREGDTGGRGRRSTSRGGDWEVFGRRRRMKSLRHFRRGR